MSLEMRVDATRVFGSQAKLARTVAVLMHLGMRVDAAIITHTNLHFLYFIK